MWKMRWWTGKGNGALWTWTGEPQNLRNSQLLSIDNNSPLFPKSFPAAFRYGWAASDSESTKAARRSSIRDENYFATKSSSVSGEMKEIFCLALTPSTIDRPTIIIDWTYWKRCLLNLVISTLHISHFTIVVCWWRGEKVRKSSIFYVFSFHIFHKYSHGWSHLPMMMMSGTQRDSVYEKKVKSSRKYERNEDVKECLICKNLRSVLWRIVLEKISNSRT